MIKRYNNLSFLFFSLADGKIYPHAALFIPDDLRWFQIRLQVGVPLQGPLESVWPAVTFGLAFPRTSSACSATARPA